MPTKSLEVKETTPTATWITVVGTLFICFLSLLGIIVFAKGFGFSPENFKSPTAVFEPKTMGVVLAILLVPLAVVTIVQRLIHKRPISDLGLRGPFIRPFLEGLGIGAGIKVVALLAAIMFSSAYQMSWAPKEVSFIAWLPYGLWYFLTLFLNSSNEELVYRAYPIATLTRTTRVSRLILVLGTAALFSAMHFLIEEPEALRFLYRFAFGLLTGILFIQRSSAATIVGLHTGWNFVALSFSDTPWPLGGLVTIAGLENHSEIIANIVCLSAAVTLISIQGRTVRRLYGMVYRRKTV